MLTQQILLAYGAAAPPPAPSITFLQVTEDTSTQTTYTFAGVNFGAADSTRRIVVVVHFGSAIARTFNSGTIGGVGATIHLTAVNTAAMRVGIMSALVPTGTSGTITVTLSGTAAHCKIASYRALNETAGSPLTANDIAGSAGLLTTTINVPANGWVVGGASFSLTGPSSHTWTGLTEQYDAPYGDAVDEYPTGGFQSGLSLQVGRTISVQSADTTTPADGALAVISWG